MITNSITSTNMAFASSAAKLAKTGFIMSLVQPKAATGQILAECPKFKFQLAPLPVTDEVKILTKKPEINPFFHYIANILG